VASNIGGAMHDAAGGWTMTTLTHEPLLVALMQTASSLPLFLLAFPAGALADVVDRRRLLLLSQTWMMLVAAALGVVTLLGYLTPWVLLGCTFALGVGAAANAPAWQAILPELVPRADLPPAVALGSVSFNVARAVGPAIGGLLVAASGPGPVFLLNAISFLGVVFVLLRWNRTPIVGTLPPEDVIGAMRAGARYVRHHLPLRTVLVRSAVFVAFASAVWSLLPLVAKRQLELGAVGYGALLGCLGVGAVTGAWLLPAVRQRLEVDRLMALATIAFAAATAAVAVVGIPVVAGAALVVAGMAWMANMSSINTAAQTSVSTWVRARALAVSLLVIQGGMALGALAWGTLANETMIETALLVSSGGLVLGLLVASRFRFDVHEGLDHTLAPPIPMPDIQGDDDDGPVLVTVEYRIDPARAPEFLDAMRGLGRVRRRDGAELWGVFRDATDPTRFVETFTVASWIEHVRQHGRMTVSDRELQSVVRGFHTGDEPPVVTHLLGARQRD
jgi:MFS family permease